MIHSLFGLDRINLDRKSGGLGGLKYPLLSDFHKKISRDYDVLIENEGIALRGKSCLEMTKNGGQSWPCGWNLRSLHHRPQRSVEADHSERFGSWSFDWRDIEAHQSLPIRREEWRSLSRYTIPSVSSRLGSSEQLGRAYPLIFCCLIYFQPTGIPNPTRQPSSRRQRSRWNTLKINKRLLDSSIQTAVVARSPF